MREPPMTIPLWIVALILFYWLLLWAMFGAPL